MLSGLYYQLEVSNMSIYVEMSITGKRVVESLKICFNLEKIFDFPVLDITRFYLQRSMFKDKRLWCCW